MILIYELSITQRFLFVNRNYSHLEKFLKKFLQRKTGVIDKTCLLE